MKIALFGASGMIGSRILDEALKRGHDVIAIVRNPQAVRSASGVRSIQGDATDPASIAATAVGADVDVSAYSPQTGPQEVDGGVPRVMVVGGAGSLEVAPGSLPIRPIFRQFTSNARMRKKAQLEFSGP